MQDIKRKISKANIVIITISSFVVVMGIFANNWLIIIIGGMFLANNMISVVYAVLKKPVLFLKDDVLYIQENFIHNVLKLSDIGQVTLTSSYPKLIKFSYSYNGRVMRYSIHDKYEISLDDIFQNLQGISLEKGFTDIIFKHNDSQIIAIKPLFYGIMVGNVVLGMLIISSQLVLNTSTNSVTTIFLVTGINFVTYYLYGRYKAEKASENTFIKVMWASTFLLFSYAVYLGFTFFM